MNNQETLNLAHIIQSLKASDVIRNDYVRQQFINVYNAIWKEGGEGAYEREAMYFNNQLRDSENLRKCTGMSVFFAFNVMDYSRYVLFRAANITCEEILIYEFQRFFI